MSFKFSGSIFLLTAAVCSLSGCGLIAPLVRTALPFAGVKMAMACLPEDAMIDTPGGARSVAALTAGDVVTGFRGGAVRVLQKHVYVEQPETEFVRVSFSGGGAVETCRMHRIDGVRAGEVVVGQQLGGQTVTGVTVRRGLTRSCDLLTEDEGYRIGGIPVNSMIEEMHAVAAGRPAVRRR